jgi:hypothetical protein
MKRTLSVTGVLLVCSWPLIAGKGADALNFFNNWFVTGDYVSAGTGLRSSGGIGTITLAGVPCTTGVGPSASIVPCPIGTAAVTPAPTPAIPVAAFLYWQTVENTAAPAALQGSFNKYNFRGAHMIDSDSSSACWAGGSNQVLRLYRADVLRYLPVDPVTHIRLANGSFNVALGQAFAGNTGVLATEGASLVVIYKVVVPGKPLIVPLRSVVIYDGVYTLIQNQNQMRQTVQGFYQASSTNPSARMTHIVGNGDPTIGINLKIDGLPVPGTDSAYTGAQGASWDNLTFNFNLAPNASSTDVRASLANNPHNCVSFAAMVTSMNVQDSDNDGLLDTWELNGIHRNLSSSPATFGGCNDYPLEPCVNLRAMGAVNGVKDIFLQIDWMNGRVNGQLGSDGQGFHRHIPKLDALTMVAKAFAAKNIALHFDVGGNYQGQNLPFIIPYSADTSPYPHTTGDHRILAEGGSDIAEASLLCSSTAAHTCAYNSGYPVLSFKLGFDSIRDGNHLLGIPAHFSQTRKDAFHYVLFAHALGGPFNAQGAPLFTDPKSTSGIADRPGGDVLVTLGLWYSVKNENDMVGSTLVQAGTLMHELGHNLDLSHGGLATTPNCSPNYPSVMSYLYQTRGLTDINGVEQIDYSNGLLAALNENSISRSNSLGSALYRIRYYGPLAPGDSPAKAASVHCDGTTILDKAQMVRSEAPDLLTPTTATATPKIPPLFCNWT